LVNGTLQDVYDKRFIQQNTPRIYCCNILSTYGKAPNLGKFLPIDFKNCFFEHRDIIVDADNMQVTSFV
jgi:hypothetical protein